MKKLIKVKFPERGEYEDDDIYENGVYDKLGEFDFFVYSYATGSYCGTGNAIFKKDGLYYEHDMGHCSCYGPLEDLGLFGGQPSLKKLLGNCSKGLNEELKLVIKKVKQIEEKNEKSN